jgi:hypothetical protein
MKVERLAALPWWSAPTGIAVGFLLPAMFLISLAGGLSHPAVTIRGLRFLDNDYLLLGSTMIVAIAIGGWIGARLELAAPKRQADDPRAWDRAAFVVGCIAALAFLIWFKDFFLHPGVLLDLLTGERKPNRDEIELTPGLTSLANTVPVFFSVYAFRLVDASPLRPSKAMHGLFAVLAVLTVFRVHAWSERLAMMEMAVPFALALGRWLGRQRDGAWPWVRNVGPIVAVPLLIVFFGLAEYSRSWGADAYQGKTSFWEFAAGRFASYYFTSLNNGAGLLATQPWPTFEFEFTAEGLHRAPFGLGKLFGDAVGYHGARLDWYLHTYQDPEFNSPSGIFGAIVDLGIQGALVYMLVIGVASGIAFRLYRGARFTGVLVYPMFFISFLEIYRYPYLGQPRSLTWAIGIAIAWCIARWTATTSFKPQPQPESSPCA